MSIYPSIQKFYKIIATYLRGSRVKPKAVTS